LWLFGKILYRAIKAALSVFHSASLFRLCLLLYELGFASFEFFLARHTAKMVGFAFICDLVFGGVFV
jgi:hypothetical protein